MATEHHVYMYQMNCSYKLLNIWYTEAHYCTLPLYAASSLQIPQLNIYIHENNKTVWHGHKVYIVTPLGTVYVDTRPSVLS